MATSQLLVVLANALILLVCGAVVVRLFTLARRTRQRPELLLGVAFLGMCVAILFLGLSGIGQLSAGEVNLGLVGVGFAGLWAAPLGFMSFTQQTFRPRSMWAVAFVLVWASGLAALLVGAFDALASAAPQSIASKSIGSWVVAVRLMVAVSGGWTSLEAYLQCQKERRRLAIGIGHPVIANRLALWAICGFFICFNNAAAGYLQSQGMGPMNSLPGASLLTFGAIFQSIVMTLALMPPAAYVRFVEARAAAAEA